MVHGAPDNYHIQQKATYYRVDDLGEQARRLGSYFSIDRAGELMIVEDFSNGLGRVTTGGDGLGNNVEISGSKFLDKGFSALLTGGSNGDLKSQIYINLPYPLLSRFGYECWFMPTAKVDMIDFTLVVNTGEILYQYYFKISITLNALYIQDSTGVFQLVKSNVNYYISDTMWQVIKFVADLENLSHVRVRTNDIVYDVDSYTPYSYAQVSTPGIAIYFDIYSDLGENGTCYLDSLILTQFEP